MARRAIGVVRLSGVVQSVTICFEEEADGIWLD
jgi:hypothetical protein